MPSHTIEFIRNWRVVLLLAIIPALQNCSRIDGSVELNNSDGAPYSFEGAKVEAFELDRAAVLAEGTKTQRGAGSVVSADGTISLQVITATIEDDALYDVEIRCPANNTTDACNVESPLHVVLSGAQLMAGDWKATALSEAVFHNVAYYAAVEYPVTEIQKMLDRHAGALLKESSNSAADYADIVTWSPDSTDSVRRPHLLGIVSEAIAAGIASNDLKRLAQQWVGPYVGQMELSAVENDYVGAFSIANGHAYIASEMSLRIIDLDDPEQPALVETFAGTHPYDDLVSSGNYLYSMWEGTLYVSDVSNPLQPQDVGETYLSYDVKLLAAAGDYVYGLKDGSFVIVDVRDPSTPVQTAEVERGYLSIAAFGTTVAVSDYGGFHLIDASNPAAPRVRSRLPFGVPDTDAELPEFIVLSGSHAYAANYGTLSIIDISNLDAPIIVATLDLPGIQDITLNGAQLYLTRDATITRVDVTDPAAPIVTGSITMPRVGFDFPRIVGAGEFLYTLTLEATQFSVIDIDRATGPVVQSGNLPLERTDDNLHFLATAGDQVYLQADNQGISIIDAVNPSTPTLTTMHPLRLLDDATLLDDYLFTIDDYQKALSIVDVSNSAAPVTLDRNLPLISRDIPFDALRDIAQSGNRLYVPWGFDTFWGSHGGCPTPGPGIEHIGGLFVIDVSTPTAPSLSGQLCLQEFAELVAIAGDHAYLALGSGLLQVVNISNPASPTLAGTVQLAATPNFLAVSGNYVWATEGKDGIEIIDVSNPAAPVVASRITTAGHATSVAFDEGYAYTADGIGGVLAFDITNPAAPLQVANAHTQNNAESIIAVDDYIYAATKSSVEVLRKLPGSL